ncbi:hypothetical protein A3D88_00410 [Candidatus Peribacteria bacterium RIFCSPHIGHO2_02_FULL_52_16]|nr:MAG: hypothetical protein A2706_01515 [Candidatus Peribacteria bacterium RIFCSPHIGHO2_01_FULL_51_35]OGJ61937.1 MAG: hypothetical protein A3D88_00410 [Candidatus Peribacteria bacterium RIFCSPHIGHO2_02_FULL_52_16]
MQNFEALDRRSILGESDCDLNDLRSKAIPERQWAILSRIKEPLSAKETNTIKPQENPEGV